MRIALVNPPHSAIGSRIPDEQLPPLGLLAVGGPLLDDGHVVRLIDADREDLPDHETLARIRAFGPDLVLMGHSGSTSAHPVVARITRALREQMPHITIVYGGVFPTYHYRDVLREEPQIDVIVRGEGEETARRLVRALAVGESLGGIAGLAFRLGGEIVATAAASVIQDLDAYRIGWELIDHRDYTYWGDKRAVVVQFSRGCPHPCNYCGQRGFWTKWRHRSPQKLAAEIARLHREEGVVVFNFADENPTSHREAWKAFCEALIAEDVPDVILVGSTRAGDIVRDKDILHLYKKAGVQRFLLGMESTDEATLELIKKKSTTTIDREAIRLLRENGILSMATWVVGFEEETWRDHWRGLRQLLSYDPDQVQLLYVTPHRWTPFFELAKTRRVIQTNRQRWDYKHQVLATRHMKPWQVLACVKLTEVILQTRPRALYRNFLLGDRGLRDAMQWYSRMGRRVWPFELKNFFLRDRRTEAGPTVEEMWGAPQAHEEKSMVLSPKLRRKPAPVDAPQVDSAHL
jgi:anaerobic magnesium-protoporphyrin IX monomethyl ester cyclase